ncbi:MAG: HEAT repeat domain-containing protein [Nitrospira sp.]|nr:HEAT repeat domain-containing protein [Nitrospira sp.]
MKTPLTLTLVMAIAILIPGFAGATSLSGKGSAPDQSSNPPPQPPPLTKRGVVKNYVKSCGKKPAKEANCDKLRKDVVEIVKDSLHTLGSSAKRAYVPTLVKYFKSDEAVLRIAAADALGMIGPQDQEADALAIPANDPVPDVRAAVRQAMSRGKGPALTLLGQRVGLGYKTGSAPEIPPDAGKFGMPVAPESTYLFYASDATVGRLSYVAKGGDPTAFFKGKAKKGPFPLEEFKDKYRYQFQDEDEAMNRARETEGKEIEKVQPPDPSNLQAYTEFMQKIASVGAKQGSRMYLDSYEPKLFGTPTVYVLEERQIGKRSYPTRYAVVYQELALKRPGYRLSWMTVPDEAIKAAQAISLAQEKEDIANQVESEAIKKKQAELDSLTKKKDAAEKKQFKKGQEDLEKELGF